MVSSQDKSSIIIDKKSQLNYGEGIRTVRLYQDKLYDIDELKLNDSESDEEANEKEYKNKQIVQKKNEVEIDNDLGDEQSQKMLLFKRRKYFN